MILAMGGVNTMVRTKKIFRQDLLEGAYSFVLEEGFQKFRARRVADYINCSTQPIYHEFADLKAYKTATQTYILAEITKQMKLDQVTSLLALTDTITLFAQKHPKEFYRFFLSDPICKEALKQLFREKYQSLVSTPQPAGLEGFEAFWYYSLGQAADNFQL